MVFIRIASFAALAAVLATAVGTAAAAGPVEIQRRVGSDTFVVGGSVRVDQPVSGDLFAAGGTVDIEAPVAGDAMLAGGNLRVGAAVERGVFAAGGRLVIDAPIGRNLRVGGGQIEIGPKAAVAGNVTVGGGNVALRGPVKGSVTVGGGRVLIDAAIDGDVDVNAGKVTLGPNARLGGALRYRSRDELVRDPAAQVAGATEHSVRPDRSTDRRYAREREGRRHGGWAAPSWIWTLGLMAIATVLVAALPGAAQRVADAWRQRFGWSLLWGFIALVCVPIAVLILLVTIIGIPLALLALLLYGVLLLVGYVASGVALGQWVLSRAMPASAGATGWRIVAALLGVLVVGLLASIPFIGGFIALLAVLAGMGAILLLFDRRNAAPVILPGAA
jgi:cytoskeletal protein CcmA (bactofilin family)